MGVLVICVFLFTVFCIVCTEFLYSSVYVYLFLFVLSVLVQGLLPLSDNSIAISNNNNNNNNNNTNRHQIQSAHLPLASSLNTKRPFT